MSAGCGPPSLVGQYIRSHSDPPGPEIARCTTRPTGSGAAVSSIGCKRTSAGLSELHAGRGGTESRIARTCGWSGDSRRRRSDKPDGVYLRVVMLFFPEIRAEDGTRTRDRYPRLELERDGKRSGRDSAAAWASVAIAHDTAPALRLRVWI